jgi:putative restriction endonuclease
LQNDGIWELTETSPLERRQGSTNPKKSELLRYDVRGGFIPEIYNALTQNKDFCIEISRRILEAHFPDSMHEDLLEAVGIEAAVYNTVKIRRRDPKFREKILRAYEYRCAICGFDVRIDNFQVALEAAHIKWHQAGGPDIEQNGLALCSLHHKLFDRGAFTLNGKLEIAISDHVHGSFGFSEWLMSFHQKPIRSPRNTEFSPMINYIDWHYKEVFKR